MRIRFFFASSIALAMAVATSLDFPKTVSYHSGLITNHNNGGKTKGPTSFCYLGDTLCTPTNLSLSSKPPGLTVSTFLYFWYILFFKNLVLLPLLLQRAILPYRDKGYLLCQRQLCLYRLLHAFFCNGPFRTKPAISDLASFGGGQILVPGRRRYQGGSFNIVNYLGVYSGITSEYR